MKKLLLFFCLPLLLYSCAVQYQPFSTDLQIRYDLEEQDLTALEFCLSHELVLYRSVQVENARTNGSGGLQVKAGEQQQKIVFRKGTPGKLTHNSGDKIGVSFENNPQRFLLFGSKSIKGNYYLLADQWQHGQGELRYGDDQWFTAPGSGNVHLEIKTKVTTIPSSKTTIVGGNNK